MNDKAALSLGKSTRIYGIEIKKLPLGAYLRAMEKLLSAPEIILKECFPDKTIIEIMEDLTKLKGIEAVELINTVLEKAPVSVVKFVSELTGYDLNELMWNEDIGITGFVEILNAFVEVNELKKCLNLLGKLAK